MWVYHSPIGDIFIKAPPDGKYGMLYDGVVWESCDTPQAQADNVYTHCTNCWDWDKLNGKVANVPHDLSEWEHL